VANDETPVLSAPGPSPAPLSPHAYLGGVAILAALTEAAGGRAPFWPRNFGPIREFLPYLSRHEHRELTTALLGLPVPEELGQVFRNWAEGHVNCTMPGTAATFVL